MLASEFESSLDVWMHVFDSADGPTIWWKVGLHRGAPSQPV